MIRLAILSPAFPPAINGLGDYSVKLGKKLGHREDVEIVYLGLPQPEKVPLVNYHQVIPDAADLLGTLQALKVTHLLINYSNYGYHRKGIPFWLINAVKQIRRSAGSTQVLTFFHEIYARGVPWKSVFWLTPVQRYLFRSLYRHSHLTFCSNERVERIIVKQAGDRGEKNENIGIISNIPEPPSVSAWEERKNTAVVFGTSGRRMLVYQKREELMGFIRAYAIDRVLDVGKGEIDPASLQIGCPVERLGELPAEAISQILQDVRYGLIDYPASLLGKSGIFASYAAYGLCPVNFTKDPTKPGDGLQPGMNYLLPWQHGCNGRLISQEIMQWYRPRRLEAHAGKIYHKLTAANLISDPSLEVTVPGS